MLSYLIVTMDLKALEYTRDHYNRHANQFVDTNEALQARATGASAPLKKFHNSIKRKMIEMFAWEADALLDLCCGRGGDIWKWFDARIKYIKGIDLSPGEVAEARQRYSESAAKAAAKAARSGGVVTQCEFEDTPNLGLTEWKEPRQYDAVTCMFALHYFFVSEPALRRFLENVALNLKEGGYFFGTVPDGKRINECIRSSKVFDSPMLRIEAHWEGQPSTFGSPYICAIGDTVTGGEQGTKGSFEYLVYRNVLEGVAARYGLKPVVRYGDAQLKDMFDPADDNALFKHFNPSFPESDESLERASRLFTAFAFQKVTGGGPAAPPPPRGAKPLLKRHFEGAAAGAAAETAAVEPPAQRQKQEDAADGEGVEKPKATFKRPLIRRRVGGSAPAAGAAAAGEGEAAQQQQEEGPPPPPQA